MAVQLVTVQKSAVMTKAHAVKMVRQAIGCCMEPTEVKETADAYEFLFFNQEFSNKDTERTVDVAPGVTVVTAEKLDVPLAQQQDMKIAASELAWAMDEARWRDQD